LILSGSIVIFLQCVLYAKGTLEQSAGLVWDASSPLVVIQVVALGFAATVVILGCLHCASKMLVRSFWDWFAVATMGATVGTMALIVANVPTGGVNVDPRTTPQPTQAIDQVQLTLDLLAFSGSGFLWACTGLIAGTIGLVLVIRMCAIQR
jgi:hypothetical protein